MSRLRTRLLLSTNHKLADWRKAIQDSVFQGFRGLPKTAYRTCQRGFGHHRAETAKKRPWSTAKRLLQRLLLETATVTWYYATDNRLKIKHQGCNKVPTCSMCMIGVFCPTWQAYEPLPTLCGEPIGHGSCLRTSARSTPSQ